MEAIQSISQLAATGMIAGVWQGLVLALAVWVGLKLAPRTPAGFRFPVWMAAFCAISLLSLLASLPGHHEAHQGRMQSIPAFSLDFRWAIGFAALWTICSAARFLGLIQGGLRLRGICRRSRELEAAPAIQALLRDAGLRRPLLCSSEDVDQPCVIGFLAPRILVPDWLVEKATTVELEQIVLHELSHLRRFDDWTNLFQKLALACFPLNPALLWIERRLCAEREVACDECVVRATQAPREYASCLTNLAEQRMTRRTTALAGALSLGAWEQRSQLAGRIENVLRGSNNSLNPLRARALLAAFLVATGGGALVLAGSAQLVSFTTDQTILPVAQVDRPTIAGAPNRYVVYRPSPGLAPAAAPPSAPAFRFAQQRRARAIAKNAVHRERSSDRGVQAFFIVTHWQDSSGQGMTVINTVVRLSALSAAQGQPGWFVVQL